MTDRFTPAPEAVRAYPAEQAGFDEGLRSYMLGIYRNMSISLAISGAVALGIASSPAITQLVFGTPLKWVAMFAPLAFVFFFTFRFERMSTSSARMALWSFAAVMGVSMASIFMVFTTASIVSTFFIASAMFLSVSLWGYTTKTDISRWSSFLFMGLIGVFIASLVNMFMQSGTLQLVVSLAGVIVFTGLTAWDTQRAKSDYLHYSGAMVAEKMAIMSAFSLYLNFVNLFQMLLSLVGVRQDE